MRILCCNIRYYGANDGDNHWEHRKEFCARVIRSREPDLICTQETSSEQYADLKAAFPEFESFGIVDNPLGRNPTNAVFYRRDAFDLVSAGGYWLSETPHVTGSSSWQSACVRLANWVRLTDAKSKTDFRLINTHLDHVSQRAREEQTRVIHEDALAYPSEYPQILTGDLNADGTNLAVRFLAASGWTDTHAAIHGDAEPGFTYHEFLGPAFASDKWGKIDWIFIRGRMNVRHAEIVRDSDGDRFPSDHYFVSADVEF